MADSVRGQIPADNLKQYENDKKVPNSRDLIILARALRVPPNYLLSDTSMSIRGLFRKNHSGGTNYAAFLETHVWHALDNYMQIEDILGIRSDEWNKPPDAPFAVHNLADAELAAERLREHWGVGQDTIPNLTELLEENRIKVIQLDMGKIDGVAITATRAGREPVSAIVVNNTQWGERRRFTISHELGHMLMKCYADEEKMAHRFAGALMMPQHTIRKMIDCQKPVDTNLLKRLKPVFGASLQAIAYRLSDLGIIDNHLFGELFDEFELLGWRSPPYREPLPIEPERPMRLNKLVSFALEEEIITRSRAAELLNVPVLNLDEHLDVSVGDAKAIPV